jgi:hypothetical protein
MKKKRLLKLHNLLLLRVHLVVGVILVALDVRLNNYDEHKVHQVVGPDHVDDETE